MRLVQIRSSDLARLHGQSVTHCSSCISSDRHEFRVDDWIISQGKGISRTVRDDRFTATRQFWPKCLDCAVRLNLIDVRDNRILRDVLSYFVMLRSCGMKLPQETVLTELTEKLYIALDRVTEKERQIAPLESVVSGAKKGL